MSCVQSPAWTETDASPEEAATSRDLGTVFGRSVHKDQFLQVLEDNALLRITNEEVVFNWSRFRALSFAGEHVVDVNRNTQLTRNDFETGGDQVDSWLCQMFALSDEVYPNVTTNLEPTAATDGAVGPQSSVNLVTSAPKTQETKLANQRATTFVQSTGPTHLAKILGMKTKVWAI